jgi:hypothetical protein
LDQFIVDDNCNFFYENSSKKTFSMKKEPIKVTLDKSL